MAIFTCRQYPKMQILVQREEQILGAGGILKTIPAVYKQFSGGRLRLDDEKEQEYIKAIRENVDYGNLIREISAKDLEALNARKNEADDTDVSCPYCLAKFDTLKRLMSHASECKERKSELSSNPGRVVRGVATTTG